MPSRSNVDTNLLLESLPPNIRNRVLERCSLVHWTYGDVVCDARQRYKQVYFPLSGFISLLTEATDHRPLEVGLIGNEGMLGTSLVLGVGTAPLKSLVQGSGTAWSIPVDLFLLTLQDNPGFKRRLLLYIHVLMQQLTLAGSCLHFHTIDSRLARWLLMTQDRAHQDRLYLTHVFLADMLGVRRSGVSLAAEALQKQQLISYTRGNIDILDRRGLEAASCSCYDAMSHCYDRAMN